MEQTYAIAAEAMRDSLAILERAVPKPRFGMSKAGHCGYRYVERLPGQAIFLKSVRMFSAIQSLKLLLDAGLFLDGGASMRILDEIGSDIQFLAAPFLTGAKHEAIYDQFLTEFFQEEFDHSEILKSSQKRHRVSRQKIRACIVRAYGHDDTSTQNDVLRVIDNAFSGYVHGAAVHMMDAYDGARFVVPACGHHSPLRGFWAQFSQYLHRALMNFALAAKALGCEEEFGRLYKLITVLFDDDGFAR
ncbi:hypothetical protein PY650_31020 [Rhizobium calliandrae]|uniref:HEPN AbiU2-like domain-containing protein n=1 Tax=Rhizobium calliandrae TaxID=1312182 RepID=A0ABT7KN11_9HYPH|nr:hypothetical protein [Rhizobium calliandrae]MDL2409972.1 hypothetical protein [Rhizobium calliandrae]